MRTGKRHGNPLSVHVNPRPVGRRGIVGVPRDDDMVKGGRITERRSARIRVVRIPGEKQLV